MTRYFLLDIETAANLTEEKIASFSLGAKIGNLKDPAKIEAKIKEHIETKIEKAALNPLTGRIVAASWVTVPETRSMMQSVDLRSISTRVSIDKKNEKDLIEDIVTAWQGSEADAMLGFNIREFDVPFLIGRMVALRCSCGTWMPRPKDYRAVVDIRDWLPEGRLAEWFAECGLPAKPGDGSDVAGWVEAGDYTAIAEYSSQEMSSLLLLVKSLLDASGWSLT